MYIGIHERHQTAPAAVRKRGMVISFIGHWNDFFRPLIFLNSFEKMTLPIGMTALTGAFGTGNLSAILAGVTLSLIVPLLFYIFGQKYLLDGITAGGLKM